MIFFSPRIRSGLTILMMGLLPLIQPAYLRAESGVKTYYKQYSIFTYENENFLCEPYQVQKDDWLYKIFRQKGEISAADFPKFLRIFKKLNPRLNNIDAIDPGAQILIPLKQVNPQTYEQKTKGVVEVPVLEFSMDAREKQLAKFIREHTIQKGDTVSTLLAKDFLKKGGAVSQTGIKTFNRLNPDIKDINKIYLGSRVLIPDPDILSQPWFETFLANGSPGMESFPKESADPIMPLAPLPLISPEDLVRLKRYAQLIQGTLMHQGEMVFPGQKGKPAQKLDLAKTPLLTEKDGKKSLILPPGAEPPQVSPDLLEGMKAYWKEIQVREFNAAVERSLKRFTSPDSMDDIPREPKKLIPLLLSSTPFSYQKPAPVPVQIGTLSVDVTLARITSESHPDLLINHGEIYGTAMTAIQKRGWKIITLTPKMTYGEITLLVLSNLGYTTWRNPSFNHRGEVRQLKGVYAVMDKEKRFITRQALSSQETDFLESQNISQLILKEPNE